MDSKRYERLREIFLLVCDLHVDKQKAMIKECCGNDQTMQMELQKLLHMDAKKTGLFESPTLTDEVKQRLTDALGPQGSTPLPDRIGHYKIVKQIGGGGMGDVFEATQDNPKRTVAIKMIKAGVASEAMLKRFEHEAHVLGLLQHPGIAQIYEAGTADTGQGAQPYFAMELVNGDSLTDYTKQKNLGTRESLELIADLCDAIQHAHSKGVIHRDLKPANILITKDGQPKILDFGVARAIDSDIQTTTMQTDIGQLIGTIQYMSPEQAKGSSDEIDTRSDVYALGVLMFEVLANKLPYELAEKMVHEAVRVIREDEPTRLSSISTKFRGDVETIVAKALEKDKDRRYQTAAELAADIRRYLNDEPIVARPASAMYQFRKFTQRNKALVGGVAAAFVILVLGIVGTSWGMVRAISAEKEEKLQGRIAKDEAERATTEALKYEEIANFTREIFLSVNPEIAQGRDTSLLREILDAAIERVDTELSDQPAVGAAMRTTIALVYTKLGNWEQSKTQFELVFKYSSTNLLETDPQHLEAMKNLGMTYVGGGLYDRAEPLLVRVHELHQQQHGQKHLDTIESMSNLGVLYTNLGRYTEAEELLKTSVNFSSEILGEEDKATLIATSRLANLYSALRDIHKVEILQRRLLEIRTRTLGENHPNTLTSAHNLANALSRLKRFDEAQQLYIDTLKRRKKILGNLHTGTISTMHGLATFYYRTRQYEKAEPLYIKTLDLRRQQLGQEHPNTLTTAKNLAWLYSKTDQLKKAEELMQEVLEISQRTLGPEHPRTLGVMNNLALIFRKLGKLDDTESILLQTLEIRKKTLGDSHPDSINSMGNLAFFLYSDRLRFEDAETILLEMLEALRPEVIVDKRDSADALNALVQLFEAWDKPGKVAEYRALLMEAEKKTSDDQSEDDNSNSEIPDDNKD